MKVLIKRPFGQWYDEEYPDIETLKKVEFAGRKTEISDTGNIKILSLAERGILGNEFFNVIDEKYHAYFGKVVLISETGDLPEDVISEYIGTTKKIERS